jgi:surface protein
MTRRIFHGLLALLVAATSLFGIVATARAGTVEMRTIVDPGQTVRFNFFNLCLDVRNNYDLPVVVPTVTDAEWTSFYRNPPPLVAVSVCPEPLILVLNFNFDTNPQPPSTRTISLAPVVHPFPGEVLEIDWGDGTTTRGVMSKTYQVMAPGETWATFKPKTFVVTINGRIRKFGEEMTVIRDANGEVVEKLCKIDDRGSDRAPGEWGEAVFYLSEIRSFGNTLQAINCMFGSLWYKHSPAASQNPIPIRLPRTLPRSVTNLDYAFADYAIGVRDPALLGEITDWDTSNVTSMEGLFRFEPVQPTSPAGEQALIDSENYGVGAPPSSAIGQFVGDVSRWNVGNVTNMREMFEGQPYFNGDLSRWDVRKVTDMSGMFFNARSFNSDISGWQTSSLRAMDRMFYNAHVFNRPLGGWDISGVTTLEETFRNARAFNQNLSGWNDKTAQLTSIRGIFDGDNASFSSGGGFYMAFNGDISGWNTGNVTNMEAAFRASDFNGDISGWNTARVTTLMGTFDRARRFNQPIGAWNTGRVTRMDTTFRLAEAFNQPIGGWNTANVTRMDSMFDRARVFNQPIGAWNTGRVTRMDSMFDGARAFNQPIGGWDTSRVTRMDLTFRLAEAFNQPIGGWNTANVTRMNSMFEGARVFNQNLNGWNVGRSTVFTSMFADAVAFNGEIGDWNMRQATTLGRMFYNAAAFDRDISAWRPVNVTSTVYMFQGARKFNADIGGWFNLADGVRINNINWMFVNASSFNRDIRGWHTGLIDSNMRFVFSGATAFVQDLSVWCAPNWTLVSRSTVISGSQLTTAMAPANETAPCPDRNP